MVELEQDLGSARQDLSGASSRLGRLEADNVALFERIRFLQQYQPNRDSSSNPALQGSNSRPQVNPQS